MTAEYDSEGNYIYPEGFDPETNEWLEGYEKQRQEWERAYAEAQLRFEQHRKQVAKATEAESGASGGEQSYSPTTAETPTPGTAGAGALASDEQLAALREKLSGSG
jgi:small subunit ribosomal protein S1